VSPITVTASTIDVDVGAAPQVNVDVVGGQGPQGPAATVSVGTVTTGAPGSSASVTNVGTSGAAVLNFTIPAGAAGTTTWAGITDKPSTFAPSLHAASHQAGGDDELYDQDLNTADDVTFRTIVATGGAEPLSVSSSEEDVYIVVSRLVDESPEFIAYLGVRGGAGPFVQASNDWLRIEKNGGDLGGLDVETVRFAADSSEQTTAWTGTVDAEDVTGLATVATSGSYDDLDDLPSPYSLPTATNSVLGGVKIGGGVTITDGVISVSTNYAAATHTHAASDINSGTLSIDRIPTGTTSTTVALGNHTHAQLHDRSHAIASTGDHTATAWRVFHSNGSGEVVELALGSAGQALLSNGATAAPSWGAAGSNSASDLTTGTLDNARLSSRARAAINVFNWSSFR